MDTVTNSCRGKADDDIGKTLVCTTENKQAERYTFERGLFYREKRTKSILVRAYNLMVTKNGIQVHPSLYPNIRAIIHSEFKNVFPSSLELFEGQVIQLTVNVSEALHLNKQVTIVSFKKDDDLGQILCVSYSRNGVTVTEDITMTTISREIKVTVYTREDTLRVSITSLPVNTFFVKTTWKWQGFEVANGYSFLFDNSRYTLNNDNIGLLYSAFSRCRYKAQLAILHKLRNGEIRTNVDYNAVLFDTYHSSSGVISIVDYFFDSNKKMIHRKDKKLITTQEYCPWLHPKRIG
jgi:hypothetical protein